MVGGWKGGTEGERVYIIPLREYIIHSLEGLREGEYFFNYHGRGEESERVSYYLGVILVFLL